MSRRKPVSTDKLPHWRDFTRALYNTWDADPGYYAIQHTAMPTAQRLRLAVAWCSYYNLAIAAEASEHQDDNFWDYLENAYHTAQRNTERRHFRGDAGRRALAQWRERWPRPEAMPAYICNAETYFDIRRNCTGIAQFGDYFIWKWCDLSEVLGFGHVHMAHSAKHSPKLPQQGALLINELDGLSTEEKPADIIGSVYYEIAQYGRARKVPPRTTEVRKFGIQEAETVCCVYKQMANGGYLYGSRTAKAVARLGSSDCRTAERMRATLLDLSPYTEAELADTLRRLKGE